MGNSTCSCKSSEDLKMEIYMLHKRDELLNDTTAMENSSINLSKSVTPNMLNENQILDKKIFIIFKIQRAFRKHLFKIHGIKDTKIGLAGPANAIQVGKNIYLER